MDTKILSILLLTHLLFLSPLNCSEERGGDSKSFGSVNGVVAGDDFIAKSGKGMKLAGKMGRAGRVFCSISTEPDQLVMFQYLRRNSTLIELSDCSKVRIGSHGEDTWGNKKIHVLDSVPIIPDGPQIQLSFYDWHGKITPTKFNDYDLSLIINNLIPDAFAFFCTLTSYEATLTANSDKFTKKTRATVHCNLTETFHQVIPETVPSSIYMAQNIYNVIQEVAKLVTFYQWGYPSFTYKISGLDIISLNLTSHTRQNVTTEEFQMTASLSFSTSLQPFKVFTVAVLVRSTFRQFENINHDENHDEPQLEGFSTDVFKEASEVLPYHFSYTLVPFYGSADQLVEEVARKACRQVEAVFCFPLALLFNEHRPRNRLSYFLLVPWLMLTLIVTTTFTASLGSIITSSQVVPSDLDIDSLKRTNAALACDGNPFTVSYLEKKIGIQTKEYQKHNFH